MTFDGSIVLGILLPVIGGIVWLIRLEGRVNGHEIRAVDIVSRLTRIENKLDRMNGR